MVAIIEAGGPVLRIGTSSGRDTPRRTSDSYVPTATKAARAMEGYAHMILFRKEHIEPILSGEKTQTRRLGKKRWNVGAIHQCKRDYMGEPFARVRILAVNGEKPLLNISQADVEAEGYGNREEYTVAFARINKMSYSSALWCCPWVVDFELVDQKEQAQ